MGGLRGRGAVGGGCGTCPRCFFLMLVPRALRDVTAGANTDLRTCLGPRRSLRLGEVGALELMVGWVLRPVAPVGADVDGAGVVTEVLVAVRRGPQV